MLVVDESTQENGKCHQQADDDRAIPRVFDACPSQGDEEASEGRNEDKIAHDVKLAELFFPGQTVTSRIVDGSGENKSNSKNDYASNG